MRTAIHAALLCAIVACAPKAFTLGDPVSAPYGYRMMCHDHPEAFACP